MNIWQRIKNFFTKEVRYLNTKELDSIFDHDRVDFNKEEFERIDEDFRIYSGDYPDLGYLNSNRVKKEREFMGLNMMNEVAKHLGSIIYNEKTEIIINNEKVGKEFIEHVLEHNEFNKNFTGYIQVMLATGGLSIKPYYDAHSKEFKFSWTLADAFIPLKSNTNNISEAVVPSYSKEVINGKTYYYTLLEFHEWENGYYIITNELYRSENEDKLGKKVDLSEKYENLKERTIYTQFSRPNFAYVKPYGFNNIDPQSPLGLGVTDNAKKTLKQIDNAYDKFWWEIKQGKRQVIVSDHFLKTKLDDKGRPIRYLDDETDVYVALPKGMDDMTHQDITKDIRADQYITSINKFLSLLETQTGLSVGTFSFDGKSVKTATEIVSENSMTYRTRNSHITHIEEFIKELIISLCELARETYDENGNSYYKDVVPTKEDIEIDFDDGVFTDKKAELDYYGKAVTYQVIPSREAMKKLFGLDDKGANEWYKSILEERMGVLSEKEDQEGVDE